MNYQKSYRLTGCVVDYESLTELTQIMTKFGSSFKMEIKFSDSTTIVFSKVEEVNKNEFENRKIVDLDLRVSLYEWKNEKKDECSLSLTKDLFSSLYELSIDFISLSNYALCKELIEKWIKKVNIRKTLINFIYSPIIYILSALFFTIPLFVAVVLLFSKTSLSPENILVSIPVSLTLMTWYLIPKWVQTFYPRTEIDLGKNVYKQRRKFLFVFFMIYLVPIASLVLSILSYLK